MTFRREVEDRNAPCLMMMVDCAAPLLDEPVVLPPLLSRFSTGAAPSANRKPCFTLMVTAAGKLDAEKEAAALERVIAEEEGASSPTFLRVATPQALHDPAGGRGMFPNLVG